ncbi:unnamed protein product [Rotaria sp. Silwood1]|nr:unnamed protein product [Rotaria sp. Silwood1]CAF1220124.1 unnamed protein product [Rotaria sp. Silwood1]CAF3469549.1 unnamed protein product [Rotaria sp. Silwood1]CAF3491425.1 unnamed protein product [Rotaria sp. Silwood1]CAF3510011.1 unnamed protein product [Rotaria sp. Silwood1]
MSVTPGLGAFNKDKVANKFGIQLKAKDTKKQAQRPLNQSTEKQSINIETSTLTENKTVSDFRLQKETNGLKTNKNTHNQTSSSQTSEPIKKSLENSIKSKSTIGLVSTSTDNEGHDSLNSNVNHSKSLNLVKSDESINSVASSSKSKNLLSSKLSNTVNKSNSASVPTDRRASLTLPNQNKLPEPSTTKRTSIAKIPEQTVLSQHFVNQSNIPTTKTKTEAEIANKKDQPLYKRQLSKTLDNVTSILNKNKHQLEHVTSSPTISKR